MVEYYAMLSKMGVDDYGGVHFELGTACGRLFWVGTLPVFDAGDSNIIRPAPTAAGTAATSKENDAPAAPDKDLSLTMHLNLALIAPVSFSYVSINVSHVPHRFAFVSSEVISLVKTY